MSDSRSHPAVAQGVSERRTARGLTTARELLTVETLRLTLVAGTDGLDRPIRWAHAIELGDPRPYLRSQELVLTMGSVLLGPDDCERFVEAVLERDAGGIGFGCGNYHPRAPDPLREACDRAGLPVVEVPVDVPFIAIIEFLAERLAEERSARARKAHRREVQLLDALAAGRGLDGIVDLVSRQIPGAFFVLGEDGAVLAAGGERSEAGDALIGDALAEASVGRRRVGLARDGLTCDLASVAHRGETIGWVASVQAMPGLADTAELLAEAASVVAIELATRLQERVSERRAVGRLLAIVRAGVADAIVLADRISERGVDADRLVAACVDASSAAALERCLAPAIVGQVDDRLYIVTDETELVLAACREQGLVAGVGSRVPLRDLVRSLGEADEAYRIGQRRRGIATWQELASLDTLLAQQAPDRLAAFSRQLIVPIVEYDARHASELLATLRTFLDEEGAIERTARRLHLHPNSLRHRLRRVEALTGRSPLRFPDQVAFTIGLWSWDADHRRHSQSGMGSVGESSS